MAEEEKTNEGAAPPQEEKTPQWPDDKYKGITRELQKTQAERDRLKAQVETIEDLKQGQENLTRIFAEFLENQASSEEEPPRQRHPLAEELAKSRKQQQDEASRRQTEHQLKEYYDGLRQTADDLVISADAVEDPEIKAMEGLKASNPVEYYHAATRRIANLARNPKSPTPSRPSKEELEAETSQSAALPGAITLEKFRAMSAEERNAKPELARELLKAIKKE